MKELLKQLGLSENATEEEALVALKKLQDELPGELPPEVPPEDNADPMVAIMEKLGLSSDASIDDILAKLDELMAAVTGPQMQAQYADRITKLEKSNKELKHETRVAHYKEIANGLAAISGTPGELATELVDLEETAGEAQAMKVVAKYKALNDRMIAAGVFAAKGTPAEGEGDEEHEFSRKVKAYEDEHKVDEPTAFNAMRKADPKLYRDYMAKRKIVTRTE